MAVSRTRGRTVVAPPRNDVYVGLLTISLLAMIAGCVFLYLDYAQYPDTKPTVTVPKGPAPTGTAPIGFGGQQAPQPAEGGGPVGAAAPAIQTEPVIELAKAPPEAVAPQVPAVPAVATTFGGPPAMPGLPTGLSAQASVPTFSEPPPPVFPKMSR